LKTADSQREIPFVGATLAAMKKRSEGFPRYSQKSSNQSAALNKYLLENGRRPIKEHAVYSLRDSINDRLTGWRAFLDTYRTVRIAPSREVREIFEQIMTGKLEPA
jgi:hypothetical protein